MWALLRKAMKLKCTWETVFFDEQNVVVGKMDGRFCATALIPEDMLATLVGMHYEYVEALHVTAKYHNGQMGEVIPKLYKRPFRA